MRSLITPPPTPVSVPRKTVKNKLFPYPAFTAALTPTAVNIPRPKESAKNRISSYSCFCFIRSALTDGKKMTKDVMIAVSAYTGSVNITGGSLPRNISRKIPPAHAVVTPIMQTPNMSIFFHKAVIDPETANATVPSSSIV